jgi:ornithine cyclodeaminase/alanine dehydrogenase-like protein (mu-crystallin family)
MHTIALDSDDVRTIVHRIGLHRVMDDLIAALEMAFKSHDSKVTVSPARSGFFYDQPNFGMLEWMPVMQVGRHATIKVVGYHPHNAVKHRLPTILSTVSLYDTATGHLIGLADATFLTALRTGAASAIASKYMARANSRTVGLIGCGAQAVTQLHALSRMFDLEAVFIFDIDETVRDSFCHRTAFLEIEVIPLQKSDLSVLVREADVLCTCTTVAPGAGPVFDDAGCMPWLHVNAVGADFPGKYEVPEALLRRSFVCPDFPAQALVEGECQRLEAAQIGPSLVDVVKHPQRYAHAREQTSIFDSTGWALEDQVALELMLVYAEELGVGRRLQLESASHDPHDPYGFLMHPLPAIKYT